MNLLIIIPAFLLAIGILVTVHEFGHFWVARKLGVKVLRFSIGFGKPLWKRVSQDADQVEYVIAALPFGGYVKMLDERECDENYQIAQADLPRAFNRQALWKRAAIVAAGPLANFLFAIVVYAAVFMLGQEATRPYVEVVKDSPADVAGFVSGDEVISINNIPVASWEDMRMLLVEEYLKSPRLQFEVKPQQGAQLQRTLDLSGISLFKEEADSLDKVGLSIWLPPHDVVIQAVLPNSPAAQAGLQAQDKVVSLDGIKPHNAHDFVDSIKTRANQSITLQVERAGTVLTLNVTPRMNPEQNGRATIGAQLARPPQETFDKMHFTQSFGLLESVQRGIDKTWQTAIVTLKLMGRMLTGEVNLKNISGPVTIAEFAGVSASIGLTAYLGFLAVVSVSLGVLNLLPIPMLDGGHLLYYWMEWIKGSPVSAEVEAIGLRIGMAVIGCLMFLALYNDFTRLLN